ncbi:MAG TPA: DUF2779 domain-containing protein [Gemmatimonadales bacterium]|nr:DUF2779 domain-containing protein [Gemmatimonadales bacterium]
MTTPPRSAALALSKSRFTAGVQCPKQLWWRVHEPDAPELEFDPATQFILNQGREVGELARRYLPGGVLIAFPHDAYHEKIAATQAALAQGAAVIYEAAFFADQVFAAVDILEREGPRFTVIEVKSSTRVKPEHIPDVAIQVHTLRRAGVNVTRAEVMHLNPECRFPDLGDLFVREDVTPLVETFLVEVPDRLAALFRALAGPLPDIAIGPHCFDPRDCPFIERCWATAPEHHVTTLYRLRDEQAWALAGQGYDTILDLPEGFRLSPVARRQVRAVRSGELVVEPGLGRALEALAYPIAYLDFETVGPAVPVWPGCGPYTAIPVQFSCHTEYRDGRLAHAEWLASGPADPRREIAAALVAACRGAASVVMYTPFEKARIRRLAQDVPDLAGDLAKIETRLVDLEPIVREHVYHPDFGGSFSLKTVLPALVPELTYDGLAVTDGQVASAELARLLFKADSLTAEQRARLRADLLAYCKMDTWAMVKLVEKLRRLR